MPDLILLDWNLPKIDGSEVLKRLKEHPDLRRIPVLVFSSSEADTDMHGAYDHYANGYIRKPEDPDVLGATDNMRKRAELPAEYFLRLKKAGVDIEKHLIVEDYADDPTKLKFDVPTYVDFRDRSPQAIFEICERVVNPEVPA